MASRLYTILNKIIAKFTDGSVTKVGTLTVGSDTKPIYLSSGTPTASGSTVGSSTTPVYLSSGTITACSAMNTACGTTYTGGTENSGGSASNYYAVKSVLVPAGTYLVIGWAMANQLSTDTLCILSVGTTAGQGASGMCYIKTRTTDDSLICPKIMTFSSASRIYLNFLANRSWSTSTVNFSLTAVRLK